MSDRDSFFAAVTANPTDDLPRLVFADWFEEQGEPARAEFIRLQCHWNPTNAPELGRRLDERAGELFRENWQRWFAPLVDGLNGRDDSIREYTVQDWRFPAYQVALQPSAPRTPLCVKRFIVVRGFVGVLSIDPVGLVADSDIQGAFSTEWPHALQVTVGADTNEWARLSHPILRRLTSLGLTEVLAESESSSLAGISAVLHDPNLSGVSELRWHATTDRNHMRPTRVPAESVRTFTSSPLVGQVRDLMFGGLDEQGLRTLTQCDRLRLTALDFQASSGTAEMGEALASAATAPHIERLQINEGFPDEAVARLAEGTRWHRLKELVLDLNSLSSAVLTPLALSPFTLQLEVLDLSDNRMFFDGDAPAALRLLARSLKPDVLRRLDLGLNGLRELPRCLTRFGDRVRW